MAKRFTIFVQQLPSSSGRIDVTHGDYGSSGMLMESMGGKIRTRIIEI
jgi:hypothetical protein